MTNSDVIRIGTSKVKTGCITCRRRRIKCDEDKPACQRCSKSKRQCEGYVPPNTDLRVIQYDSYRADQISPGTSASPVNASWDSNSYHQQGRGGPSHYGRLTLFSIGGFRTDCFNALPIKSTYDVQLAFDNLSSVQFANMKRDCRDSYIRWMLNDEMFFEAMITFSKISMLFSHQPRDRITHDIRIHLSNVLPRLASRLSSTQIQSYEAVAMTTYYLLVLYLAAGDLEAFSIHFAGLKRMPASQPKPDSPWLDGFMSARIRSAELVAMYFSKDANILAAATEQIRLSHPPAPRAEKSASLGIPRDFQPIADSHELSTCGIDFLTNIDHYLGRPYVPASKDWMPTLLALRMIESLSSSMYPAHDLMTSEQQGQVQHHSIYSTTSSEQS